ncbi:DUF6912 family protein [Gephyromycinifex aptenodytis]|uniref:DUF6912 family protein n=1 Tax=Gephyromycinifex aptenodytis TaxID=2716227 RepID=UPI001444C344|nr:hypothetical protein [Gephyromycinifex aptenodytis]
MTPRPGALHRIYLAAGIDGLDRLLQHGELQAPGFIVTDAMRAADERADEEDLEYEALLAAEDYLRQREEVAVVVAADVTPAEIAAVDRAAAGADEIEDEAISAIVPRGRVVAVHVPEPGAPANEELLWFDVSELAEARRVAAEAAHP